MTPKTVSIDDERAAEIEKRRRQACDQIIERAAHMMVAEAGASIGMMLDRMLTYALAQGCTIDGSPKTAAALREFADKIDAGLFHPITGEGSEDAKRH